MAFCPLCDDCHKVTVLYQDTTGTRLTAVWLRRLKAAARPFRLRAKLHRLGAKWDRLVAEYAKVSEKLVTAAGGTPEEQAAHAKRTWTLCDPGFEPSVVRILAVLPEGRVRKIEVPASPSFDDLREALALRDPIFYLTNFRVMYGDFTRDSPFPTDGSRPTRHGDGSVVYVELLEPPVWLPALHQG